VERLRQRYPGMELLSSDQYAGATRDSAKRAAEALLARHGKEVTGVFTPNESSTTGMLMALQGARDAGRIAFIGFDSSDTIIEGLRHKQIQGLVVQDPFRMGELGVKTLFDHLSGKAVQKSVDTGATMIAPENVDAPVAQRLLHPPTAD
jgi:ribose transport system substrate-binding protein